MQTTERPVIMQLMEAMERGDREAAAQLVHEDVVMEWPQSQFADQTPADA